AGECDARVATAQRDGALELDRSLVSGVTRGRLTGIERVTIRNAVAGEEVVRVVAGGADLVGAAALVCRCGARGWLESSERVRHREAVRGSRLELRDRPVPAGGLRRRRTNGSASTLDDEGLAVRVDCRW